MRRKSLAVVGLAAALATVAGVSVAALDDDPARRSSDAAQLHRSGSNPDAGRMNVARYAVLKRARSRTDAIDAGLHPESLPVPQETSRRLRSDVADAWLSGDDRQLCISVRPHAGGGGTGCNGAAESEFGFAMTQGLPSAGALLVVGVVPDGVDDVVIHMSDGRRLPRGVRDNSYAAQVNGSTSHVSWNDGTQTHTWPLPNTLAE